MERFLFTNPLGMSHDWTIDSLPLLLKLFKNCTDLRHCLFQKFFSNMMIGRRYTANSISHNYLTYLYKFHIFYEIKRNETYVKNLINILVNFLFEVLFHNLVYRACTPTTTFSFWSKVQNIISLSWILRAIHLHFFIIFLNVNQFFS